ncbi:HIT domain-containing protein [Candidatus Foliamicus sp.]
MTYDSGNIFARILAGEAQCHRLCEDEHALAILDVAPRADGHALVLPKAPAVDFLSLPADAVPGVFAITQHLARAVREAFAADGVLVQVRNGAAAGQVIFHMHIHVIPCHDGQRLKPPGGALADHDLLAGHARRIREALAPQTGQ